ncbi:response regulator [Paenibacillus methanolicus]|uniref:Two-component system response regulator YesN n=1 Tax=Paenibacillus methanolicus TaxID=582686 RepID=A0A5S5C230_9BACL|nr:response regulator [Paenibacillus methanolicus]TYP73357.1 two-component system response regulator YesN [Paenibacillus methanolicus]
MRLLIVDDGHYIVEYVKHLVDWGKMGFDEVATTTNSIHAKQLLSEGRVDILLTDIRMPEVSGIDLLQHVKDRRLDTQVVFLTGYSDFEYTRTAIRLGAADYLLKPVDKEDMEKTMKSVLDKIPRRPASADIDWEKFDGLGCLLSLLCGQRQFARDYSGYQEALREEPFRFFEAPGMTEKEEMLLRDQCGHPSRFIWTAAGMAAGLIPASRAAGLPGSIPAIRLSDAFTIQQTHMVRLLFYQFFLREQIGTDDFELLQGVEGFPNLEPGEWECSKKKLLKRFASFRSRKHKAMFLLETIHFLYSTASKLPPAEVKDWMFNQLQDPVEAIKTIMQRVDALERCSRVSNDAIIRTVRQFIADHLSEGLSLEDLGRIAHLHPVYLSKLYKQETGENLSAYIAAKRLEKGAQLLLDSSLHVVDISLMVGYKKPQYFIKLFKDEYGMTPSHYRRKEIGKE